MAVVLGAATVGFAVAAVSYLSYQGGGGSFGGVMGQMMGNSHPYGMTSTMPTGVWVLLVALLVLAVVGALGVVYYLAFPEIRSRPMRPEREQRIEQPVNPAISWEVLTRTAKPEEKKVLDILAAHDGRYLQKFIVKESGLSRLKTHRILSRFAERGIVVAEKSGNTNEIALAPWLHPGTSAS